MSRLATIGFDTYDLASEILGGTTSTPMSTPAARTGTNGFRTGTGQRILFTHSGTLGRTYFWRTYIRKSTNPSAACTLVLVQTASSTIYAEWNTDGTITLRGPAASSHGTSAALSNSTWYRLELSWQINSGAGADDYCELLLDGQVIGSTTTTTISTTAHTGIYLGSVSGSVLSSIDFDDVAFNDNQGASQNSWPGPGKCVLLVPVSTNQAGSWTGGAGGAATFTAVKWTPPAGLSAETNDSQIETGDSSGNNATDEFRVNLTTYTDAGITASDVINVLHPIIDDGQEVATGTKTGSFGLQSNPSDTYATFTFCDDVGASGNWNVNWRLHSGTVTYNPSVTLGSSPVLAVRKTDTGTRLAWVDFMGVYADYYTPTIFNPNTIVAPNIYPSQVIQQRSRW